MRDQLGTLRHAVLQCKAALANADDAVEAHAPLMLKKSLVAAEAAQAAEQAEALKYVVRQFRA